MRTPLVLLLLAIPVYFLSLGANSIWDANEAFYVETPRQMIASGDYINPTFNAQPRENKPVLSYWIVAGAYRVFGQSVAVERLAIAVGALGIIIATFLIGRALGGTPTGVLAALLIATAPRVMFFSRRIAIDTYLTMFMALALAFFVCALRTPARRRVYLVAMYVAIGLGFLTKGPIAVALPVLACVVWLVTERRFVDIRQMLVLPGTLIVVLIAAPWWGALYAERGWAPLYDFFITENFGRYSQAMTTHRPFWFFLPTLFADILLPWAPLLVVAMAAYRPPDGARGDGGIEGRIQRLLWWWIVAIVLFFSMAASKEDLYIYPVMPAAAVLIAHTLMASEYGARQRGVRAILVGVGVFCVGVGAAVFRLFGSGYYAVASAPSISAVLILAGIGAAMLTIRGRGRPAVWVLAAGFVALNYLIVLRALPGLERLKPVPPLARTILERGSPDASVAFCNLDLPSFVYYLDRPVTPLDCLAGLAAAEQFYTQYREPWIITSDREWAQLEGRLPGACVADRRPIFDVRIGDLIDRRAPKDVLLVTNKCK